jgi:hypothetical protein
MRLATFARTVSVGAALTIAAPLGALAQSPGPAQPFFGPMARSGAPPQTIPMSPAVIASMPVEKP